MIKNNYGFTFVELLVVMAIMLIISIYGVFSFLNTQEESSFNDKVMGIKDIIYDYDKKIGGEITDYEISFLESRDFYIIGVNNLYKDNLQEIIFSSSYTGTLKTNSTSTGTYKIDIYKDSKFVESKILSSTGTQDYNFSSGSFTIKGYLNSQELNTFYINKYLPQDDLGETSYILLSTINDNNGNALTGAVLKNNISKNKQLLGNGSNLDNIKLNFSKNSLYQTLILTK